MLLTIVSWGMLIIPWLTLFFINKQSLRRFLPVALVAAVITTYKSEYAITNDWWQRGDYLFASFTSNIPLVLGAFFVGTIWIYHFTYGRFWLYVLVNLAVDTITMYPLTTFLQNIGMYQLTGVTRWEMVLGSVAQASVLYLFQMWYEGRLTRNTPDSGGRDEDTETAPALRFGRKQKAR